MLASARQSRRERGLKERIYLCGNRPFPTRLLAFVITSTRDSQEKCCGVTASPTEMLLCEESDCGAFYRQSKLKSATQRSVLMF